MRLLYDIETESIVIVPIHGQEADTIYRLYSMLSDVGKNENLAFSGEELYIRIVHKQKKDTEE